MVFVPFSCSMRLLELDTYRFGYVSPRSPADALERNRSILSTMLPLPTIPLKRPSFSLALIRHPFQSDSPRDLDGG